MTIQQVRDGRRLAVNLNLDLRCFPSQFIECGVGRAEDGSENQIVTYVKMKNTGDHIDLMQPEFEAVQAAKDYYHFRVKKWIYHRLATELELAKYPKEFRKKLRLMNFQVL